MTSERSLGGQPLQMDDWALRLQWGKIEFRRWGLAAMFPVRLSCLWNGGGIPETTLSFWATEWQLFISLYPRRAGGWGGGCGGMIKAHWCSCVWTRRLKFDQQQPTERKLERRVPAERFLETAYSFANTAESLNGWKYYVWKSFENCSMSVKSTQVGIDKEKKGTFKRIHIQ